MIVFSRDELTEFDIGQIASSGQCFRILPCGEGIWEASAFGKRLRVEMDGRRVVFSCDQDEFERIWKDYFDLDTDYGAFIRSIDPEDAYLMAASKAGSGIRILRQDTWEMMVTFVISQNNNIPRIRGIVNALCERLGKDGSFPEPEVLCTADLSGFRMGYRDVYVSGLARLVAEGSLCPEVFDGLADEDARKLLLSIKGIGPKVADCILLFGLHRLDYMPMDTWMKRIIKEHYGGRFPKEKYKGCNGVMQQYLFNYAVNGEQRT
jgi:N-glycosylase/DNA lyase